MSDGGNSHRHPFHALPAKPVFVKREVEDEEGPASAVLPPSPSSMAAAGAENTPPIDAREQEEALVALVEFRSREVERLRLRLEYYKSQVEDAEKKLNDSKAKLALLRSRSGATSLSAPVEAKGSAKPSVVNGGITVKEEETSPARGSEQQLRPQPSLAAPPPETQRRQQQPPQPQSRPPLIIPAVRPKPVIPSSSTDAKVVGRAGRLEAMVPATSATVVASSPGVPGTRASPSHSSQSGEAVNRLKRGAPCTPCLDKCRVIKNSKMKFVQKEHSDLVSSVRRSSSPSAIRFQPGVHVSSVHKRKLRCLEINPVQDQLFVTSALDGVVNLWQLQPKGPGASVLSTTDCLSSKQRRWPEDIAWHPDGDHLFIVYSADAGDTQIAMLNLNSSSQKRVTFLPEKPHTKGIINSIQFMPTADLCFATGGSDHAVILWHEGDSEDEWKPKAVHRSLHSAAVMGVAGLQQKKVVLSVGVDKRIIGFDLAADRAEFTHQIETKCLSVLPNPSDFNLFMVQSGTPQKQLRLFDIRLRRTELHSFGWKQERSESQSALINQAWSPDGLFISSGSADPMIHIFDIRYNSHNPSQSVQAHQKRVFKAAWHQSLPLLISISSDLNLGIHKIT